jgi:hypothetical protein
MIQGYFEIEIDNDVYVGPNLVVDAGKKLIMRLLTGTYAPLSYIKIGSSSTAVDISQTDLLSAIGSSKTIDRYTIGQREIVFETTYGYNEGNGTIREIAIFASDGTMYARKVVPDRTKTSLNTMKIRYKIKFEEEI